MDAFDRFWEWAEKPLDSPLTIPAELHRAVMELSPEDRRDRAKVQSGRCTGGFRPMIYKRSLRLSTLAEKHHSTSPV